MKMSKQQQDAMTAEVWEEAAPINDIAWKTCGTPLAVLQGVVYKPDGTLLLTIGMTPEQHDAWQRAEDQRRERAFAVRTPEELVQDAHDYLRRMTTNN